MLGTILEKLYYSSKNNVPEDEEEQSASSLPTRVNSNEVPFAAVTRIHTTTAPPPPPPPSPPPPPRKAHSATSVSLWAAYSTEEIITGIPKLDIENAMLPEGVL